MNLKKSTEIFDINDLQELIIRKNKRDFELEATFKNDLKLKKLKAKDIQFTPNSEMKLNKSKEELHINNVCIFRNKANLILNLNGMLLVAQNKKYSLEVEEYDIPIQKYKDNETFDSYFLRVQDYMKKINTNKFDAKYDDIEFVISIKDDLEKIKMDYDNKRNILLTMNLK